MSEVETRLNRRAVLGAGLAGAAALAMPSIGRAADKKLSLILFGPTSAVIDWFNKSVLPDFKQAHGYDIELRQSDWGSGFQKLLTGTASGTLPDVVMLGEVMTCALAARGAFLPIEDYLAKWSDTEKFYPAMLKDGTYGGHSYAVPVYADVRTAVYRGDLVSKVGGGTSPDDLPKTWDDFRALAGKLAKKNGGPLDAPFFGGQDKSVGLMQVYSQLLYQAGGNYFDADGKAALSGEAGTRALDYLLSFYKDGLANPNLVYQGTGRRPLVAGIAAMTYSSWNVQQNAVLYAPEVEKAVVAGLPLTAEAGGKPVGMAWINKFAISSHTKDPDGSWALLSYLTSKDIASRFGELYGGLPSRSDLEDAAYLKTVSPGFVMSSKYAAALPTNPNLLQIQQQVNIALQAAIRQSAPPKQLLADLDQKIDSINAK